MGDIPTASDNDGTNMDDSHHDSAWEILRLIDFQKVAIDDSTVRYRLRWIRCHVCGLNQPEYQVEKAQ
jgi:hypothetical protein